MLDVQQSSMPLADWIISVPGMNIGVSSLSLLGNEHYLWVERVGEVSRATIRQLVREFAKFQGFRFIVNVDSRDLVAVRFAEFFGFACVQMAGPYLIMEKN